MSYRQKYICLVYMMYLQVTEQNKRTSIVYKKRKFFTKESSLCLYLMGEGSFKIIGP
uniref:Uncharacterized protein n=1 Tax=Octopus bimaculoides TaxID=37653 RepID=A0A0L8FRD6_OCTBM